MGIRNNEVRNGFLKKLSALACISILTSCGGGSSSTGGQDGGCDGSCANQSISSSEVEGVLRRITARANQYGVAVTAAVTDRVGNVLAVYQMSGARGTTRIDGKIGAVGGLEGAEVPSVLAAISKAGTGAYLSSQGNAFSTRTASQIVQENFLPGEARQPAGPLFGVQFSQLPCSDLMNMNSSGPRPLPLGLAADPGGIPLYKAGDVVGGVAVEFNGTYSLDRNVRDTDTDNQEEEIALAGAFGFEAPENRTGAAIFAGGKTLRFADAAYPANDPLTEANDTFNTAQLVAVQPFFSGSIRSGVAFGSPESGIIKTVRAASPAAILSSVGEGVRRGGSLGGSELTAEEVSALLDSALLTAGRTRAAIRRPLDTPARVSIFVVDHTGTILGFVRSEDAPVFGIDVALQKARTAAFFSRTEAGSRLAAFSATNRYASSARSFTGREIFDGSVAFGSRSIGNLARPFYPDGINTNSSGPLSLPFPGAGSGSTWSPFNTGLQLDLILQRVVAPLSGVIPSTCTDTGVFGRALANGIQIFPGSVPLYRNGIHIGAIGISGDGVDQDDLVAYYGASRAGLNYAGHPGIGGSELGFNAPHESRSDRISIPGTETRLRYINCPEAPFIEDNEQNVCE